MRPVVYGGEARGGTIFVFVHPNNQDATNETTAQKVVTKNMYIIESRLSFRMEVV